MANYIGNNDYRGYLNYLAKNGDSNAAQALQVGVGNDGNFNINGLTAYYDSPMGNRDAEKNALKSYAQNQYATWNNQVLDASTTRGAGLGGGGGSAPANTAADERAYYDDQIANINSLLGLTDSQYSNGLSNLQVTRDRLNDSRTKAMAGYDAQGIENAQDKQRGVEQVDSFANNSYTNLQRVLQGGNAGVSSAARELVPYLVSKSAGARRQGVFDQAGKNDQQIATARGDADTQFKWQEEDLGGQEKSFREGILNKKNQLESERRDAEIKKAQANGAGYAQARAAGEASRNSIQGRMAELSALFGQFKPTYRDPNLQKPELGKFTVDPAQLRTDSSLPAESRYYQSQIKKKQEEQF